MTSRAIPTMLGLSTAVLVLSGLYFARSILAPVAFSLFVIAIVWRSSSGTWKPASEKRKRCSSCGVRADLKFFLNSS